MASTIASETFLTLKGLMQPMGVKAQDITRPNVDGRAFLKIGKRGDRFRMLGVRPVNSIAQIATRMNAYKALECSLQTVVDDAGNSANNVMVHNVRGITYRRVTTAVGGAWTGATFLVVTQWELELTE